MTLPGFNAETSLYKTSVHYRLMEALVQADGVLPQFCGPCHYETVCVQDCEFCTPRFGCSTFQELCDDRACRIR